MATHPLDGLRYMIMVIPFLALLLRYLFGLNIVGLTGGIGSGKSTATRVLRSLGACVIDFDHLAREVVELGESGWMAIRTEFGRSVFNDDDTLNRKALGDLVFGQPEQLQKLNGIMRSHIRWAFIKHLILAFFWRYSRVVVIDVPLLFEQSMQYICSETMLAYCTEQRMIQRVMYRDKVDEDDARRRIAAQWPIDRKKRLATYVLENTGTLPEFEYKVGQWWRTHQKRFTFSYVPTFLAILLSTAFCLFLWLLIFVVPWLGGSGASHDADNIKMTSTVKH